MEEKVVTISRAKGSLTFSARLLNRIYIHIEVPRVDYEKLSGGRAGEPSEWIGARIQAPRDMQTRRFSSNGSTDLVCNADMPVGEIRQFCKLLDIISYENKTFTPVSRIALA